MEMRKVVLCLGLATSWACNTIVPADAGGDALNEAAADSRLDIATSDVPADAVGADTVDVPTADASDAGSCTLTRVIVGVSDYTAFGGFLVGTLASHTLTAIPSPDAGGVYQDHSVHGSGCMVFDLENSSPSTVVSLDATNPLTPLQTTTLPNVPAGADGGTELSNPYDILVLSPHKAYVAQYNSPLLAIIDPTSGTVTGHVDLTSLADADGIPEMDSLAMAGGFVFVGLQLLSRPSYTPPVHSAMAVVNPTTDTLVSGIVLTAADPQTATPVSTDGRYVLVAEPGGYGAPASSSALDVIDTETLLVTHSITGDVLGGNPTSVAVVDATHAWVTFDRTTGDAGVVHVIASVAFLTASSAGTDVATSAMYTYGNLRRAPDGTIWTIGSDYNMGSVQAFASSGAALLVPPVTVGSLNTTSLDFAP